MYFLWPTLAQANAWTPDNLPNSTLRIVFGTPLIRNGSFVNITDGYKKFSGRNPIDVIHVDHHALVLTPFLNSNRYRIVNGNDGGIAISDDEGTSFIERGNSYNTTQLYGVDKKIGANQYIFGSQDNGCWFSTTNDANANTTYNKATGGDGFETIWHNDGNRILTSAQYNNIYGSSNGGSSFRESMSGLGDVGVDSVAPFITRLASSKSSPNVVFSVGRRGVWRSTTFGSSWNLVPISQNWAYRATSTASPSLRALNIHVSLANPQIIWAGAGMSSVTNLYVSVDGGQNFKMVNNYNLRPTGAISGLTSHPTEPNTAFAIFSIFGRPKILVTKDLGNTWQDLSGFNSGEQSTTGFPDVAVYSLFVFPNNTKRIWAGTEIGIFETLDEGKSWAYSKGVPATAIWQMKLVDNQIVVATHGRGVWTATLPPSDIPTGNDESTQIKPLKIYPNPAQSQVSIEMPIPSGQKIELKINDLTGKTVIHQTVNYSLSLRLNTETLAQGTYIIEAQTKNELFRTKLIIQR
jgi:hypothetical protein